MNYPGQDLKKERESKGISLQEISNSTRITLKLLTALEEDRLDIFPGTFFVKAVLRSYAKAVGLNEEQVLERYREVIEAAKPEVEVKQETRVPGAGLSDRRLWFYSAAAVMILAIIIITFLVLKKDKPAAGTSRTIAAPAARQEQVPTQAKIEPEPRTVKPPEDSSLEISLDFVEETWIQLFSDGEVKLNGLLFAGQRFTTRALKEININIGNAGGVTFTLNGKRGKPFGLRGEVLHGIRITPDNLREFLLPGQDAWSGTSRRTGRS